MHSKDKLAEALEAAGLRDMSAKARAGYYHDYLSPLATPCLQLEADLRAAGTPEALAVRARHLNGEFDATREEGEEWMNSDDGREALSLLSPQMREALFGRKP